MRYVWAFFYSCLGGMRGGVSSTGLPREMMHIWVYVHQKGEGAHIQGVFEEQLSQHELYLMLCFCIFQSCATSKLLSLQEG